MTVPLKRKTRQYSGMVFEKDRSGYSTERLASIPHLSFDPPEYLGIDTWFHIPDKKLRFRSHTGEIYETDRDVVLDGVAVYEDYYLKEDFQSDFEQGAITGLVADSESLFLDSVEVPLDQSLRAVSCGLSFISVVRSDGSVWSQGNNFFGQLGDGTREDRQIYVKSSSLIDSVTGVAAGSYHALALKEDGSVWVWGRNNHGQLGNNSNDPLEVPVQIISDVSQIAAGYDHSLVLKEDGTVWAWGRNDYGQLGLGDLDDRLTPVEVITGISSIGSGYHHSLFVKNDGSVFGCGINTYYQLGDAGGIDEQGDIIVKDPTQIAVTGLTNIINVAGGDRHSIALKNDGTIWCWGDNHYEQLCRDMDSVIYGIYYSEEPLQVFEEDLVTPVYANKIAAGQFSNYIYDITFSKLRAWGYCGPGLTDRTTSEWRLGFCLPDEVTFSYDSPQDVWSGSDINIWAAGFANFVWQKNDNKIYGTGDNDYGQLFGKGLLVHEPLYDSLVPIDDSLMWSLVEIETPPWEEYQCHEQNLNPYLCEGTRERIYNIENVGATIDPSITLSVSLKMNAKLIIDLCLSFDGGINWTDWKDLFYMESFEGDYVTTNQIQGFPLILPALGVQLKIRERFSGVGTTTFKIRELTIDIPSVFI